MLFDLDIFSLIFLSISLVFIVEGLLYSIFPYYMKKVYADSTLNISTEEFEKPEQPLSIILDCELYKKQNSFGSSNDENFQ